jgi:hypothetical protein
MKNPFASVKKKDHSQQGFSGDNIAGVDHLEYGGQLPNSTSYDSSLEVMANSGSSDTKDPYAPQHVDTSLSRTGSREMSRLQSRNNSDDINPVDHTDAGPTDSEDKPEDTNLYKMMVADLRALVRIYKAMSWKQCFKTLTQRYLWSESGMPPI